MNNLVLVKPISSIEPKQYGIRLLLDGVFTESFNLRNIRKFKELLRRLSVALEPPLAGESISAKLVPHSEKSLGGLSGYIIFNDSYLAVHSFSSRSLVIIDFYASQSAGASDVAYAQLLDALGVSDSTATHASGERETLPYLCNNTDFTHIQMHGERHHFISSNSPIL